MIAEQGLCWLKQTICRILGQVERRFKGRTKPAIEDLAVGTVANLTRNKYEQIAQNALLSQQLPVLQRRVKRPQMTPKDRRFLVLLASMRLFQPHSSTSRSE